MAELNARDTKLVQYLNEALTKEKQLEQALQAHIEMTTLAPYRKRLQQHLSETKRHAREVERRVKKLGGTSEGITGVVQDAAGLVQDVAAKGAALAQGPVHMVRGTSEQEVLLKNARTEFKEEAEEIANYTAIQKLAETVGDKDTAQLAKAILREEKRMAGFLEKLIPRLTNRSCRPRSRAASATAAAGAPRRAAPPQAARGPAARRRGSTAKRSTAKRYGQAHQRTRPSAPRRPVRAAPRRVRAAPPARVSSGSSGRRTTSGRASCAARRRAAPPRAAPASCRDTAPPSGGACAPERGATALRVRPVAQDPEAGLCEVVEAGDGERGRRRCGRRADARGAGRRSPARSRPRRSGCT